MLLCLLEILRAQEFISWQQERPCSGSVPHLPKEKLSKTTLWKSLKYKHVILMQIKILNNNLQ